MEPTTNAIPWYKSQIIIGAVVSIVSKVLVGAGFAGLSVDDQSTLVNGLILLIGFIGDAWAIYQRAKQQQAPKVVATQATADLHNAAATDTHEGGIWPLHDGAQS